MSFKSRDSSSSSTHSAKLSRRKE